MPGGQDTHRELHAADKGAPVNVGWADNNLRVFQTPERFVSKPKLNKRRGDFDFDIDDADAALLPAESESDRDPDTDEEEHMDVFTALMYAPQFLVEALLGVKKAGSETWDVLEESWGDFQNAKTVYVTPQPVPDFDVHVMHETLQFRSLLEAYAACKPGDSICLYPGRYTMPSSKLIIAKERITIFGLIQDTPEEVTLVSEVPDQDCLAVTAKSARFRNFTLSVPSEAESPSKGNAIDITSGSAYFENCIFKGQVSVHKAGAKPGFSSCTFQNSTTAGLCIYDSAGGIYKSNTFTGAATYNISVLSKASPVFSGNTVHKSRGSGLIVDDEAAGSFSKNTFCNNTLHGIVVANRAKPKIYRNDIHTNGRCGVQVKDRGFPRIYDNQIHHNKGNANLESHSRGRPKVSRNKIFSSQKNGVLVHKKGRGVFKNNAISESTLAGLEIATEGLPTMHNNDINSGATAGIFAHDRARGRLSALKIEGNATCGIIVASDAWTKFGACQVYMNAKQGVMVMAKGNGYFSGCEVRGNGREGMYCCSGTGPIFTANEVTENALSGIMVGQPRKPENVGPEEAQRRAQEAMQAKEEEPADSKSARTHRSGEDEDEDAPDPPPPPRVQKVKMNTVNKNGGCAGIEVHRKSNPIFESNIVSDSHIGLMMHEGARGTMKENDISNSKFCNCFLSTLSSMDMQSNTLTGSMTGVVILRGACMNGMDNTIEGTEWTGVMINEAEVAPNGDAWPAGKLNSIDDVLKPQGKLKYHHQDNDDPTIRSYQPSCILPGTFCFSNLDDIPEIKILGR